MSLVNHYNIYESELKNYAYSSGAMYYCSDTGNVYLDSLYTNERVLMSSNVIILSEEDDRTSIIAPLPNKIYCVISTGRMYVWDTTWKRLGPPQMHFTNVVVDPKEGLTISNSEIRATSTATFVPDLSVADLCSSSSAVCSNGKVTVTCVSNYPIPGSVIVN